jgi:hypothetical protein
MSSKLLGAAVAALVLGGASFAQAGGYQTIDLSPYVNQSLDGGWSVDGLNTVFNVTAPFAGVQFNVAYNNAGNSFWYGLDDGTGSNNLFAPDPSHPPLNSFTINMNASSATSVYTLANNTFGTAGQTEFSVTFQGAGGTITDLYVGAQNTKDYLTSNCATTGCDSTPGATPWYFDGTIVYNEVQWILPQNFGLTSITFNQIDGQAGAIVMGVTLGGVPEPQTWALMIGGFGLAGAALRRRRAVALA